MRNPGGYAITTLPGSRPVENDTLTCPHCNSVSFLAPAPGGHAPQVMIFRTDGTHYLRDVPFCRNCWNYVCPRCDGKDCVPFERKLDEEERAARRSFQCL